MLEAVNSVLSNSSYIRPAAEQQSTVNSYAKNPERVQQVTQQPNYISFYIKVDSSFDKAILQIRDTDTGDVIRQIPTESQLEAYRRAQSTNDLPAPAEKESSSLSTQTVSSSVVQDSNDVDPTFNAISIDTSA